MLLSNGLHLSKNFPVKFGFSPKTVPVNIAKKLPLQLRPQPFLIPIFNFSYKRPTFAFTGESGYTLAFRRKMAHSGLHAETRAFRVGALSLPSACSARSQTSPGRVSERRILPLFGLDRVCSQRTQRAFGTAMRSCASLLRRRRGPAGLRDLFRFCRNCGLYALRSGPFRVCEARGGITTLGAFHTVRKPCVAVA